MPAIILADYDSQWPHIAQLEMERIGIALGSRLLRIEHVGSTSVPGLAAKPVIDLLIAVGDSADESLYTSALESLGYALKIREPDWFEHRLLRHEEPAVNLHVFSTGCPEIERMLLFRDWLRRNAADRDLYARTKQELAQREWNTVQDYADAKNAVVAGIMSRAAAG
jgi:GrpB-like predicted nucleotidyltransferase (UPF0157 family)